jgi:hypothetical protein
LGDKTAHDGESFVVIGGTQGPALDEVLLTREKLLDSGFSAEEADKAMPFLHSIRFNSPNPVIHVLDEVLLTREKLLDSGFSAEETEKVLSFLHGIRSNSSNSVIPVLDEVLLTREKLLDSGFSAEEADKAMPFLHGIRFNSPNSVILALLLETLNNNNVRTAEKLRQSIISVLNTDAVSYNLSTDEGLNAYFESGHAAESKISKQEVQTLLREDTPQFSSVHTENILKVQPVYKAQGNIAPFNRSVPRGNPEKIYIANEVRNTPYMGGVVSYNLSMDEGLNAYFESDKRLRGREQDK